MRKTKIVCTIGPACDSKEMMRKMIDAGMNVARINMSHGVYDRLEVTIKNLKEAIAESGQNVAILLDTKGPEVRVGTFKDGSVELVEGAEFSLFKNKEEGDETGVSLSFPKLVDIFESEGQKAIGRELLLDDGIISLVVKSVNPESIVCTVNKGGVLKNRKSINIPGYFINMPYVSAQDRKDIEFGLNHGATVVAASFVRNHDDVRTLRDFIDSLGYEYVEIIAKIENLEGVKNIDEILESADGIMVARGDLGVEIPFEQIPAVQKELIRKGYQAGKQVITATQMLESMITNSRPTRAEITDVANAIYDGTSAIMLSGETAAGSYPVEVVRTMDLIAKTTEDNIDYKHMHATYQYNKDISNAIAHATVTTAHDLDAKAILTVTMSGVTAREISKYRPKCPIISCTISDQVWRQMNLSWGVHPLMIGEKQNTDELFEAAVDAALENHLVDKDDIVVITAGATQKPGETRIDLTLTDTKIVKSVVTSVMKNGFDGILVVACNPVDIMTYVAQKISGLPANRVIGSGTLLDTARLRFMLSEKLHISTNNVHAYIMGEHGDTSFVPWSHSYIGSKKLLDIAQEKNISIDELNQIYTHVQQAGYEIVNRKKSTYYGIGLSLNRLIHAIFNDEEVILTVSCLQNNEYGYSGIYNGVPAVITKNGIQEMLVLDLTDEEKTKFIDSCKTLQKIIDEVVEPVL